MRRQGSAARESGMVRNMMQKKAKRWAAVCCTVCLALCIPAAAARRPRQKPDPSISYLYAATDAQTGEHVYITEAGTVVDIPGLEDTFWDLAEIEETENGRLFPAKKDGLWGYVASSGEWRIEPQYLRAFPFLGGMALVIPAEGRYAYIDCFGASRLQWEYPEMIGPFRDGIAIRCRKWGDTHGQDQTLIDLIDPDGICLAKDILIDNASFVRRYANGIEYEGLCFSEGRLLARLDGKYGFLDTQGEWVIPPQYEEALAFSEGLAAVCLNGNYGYIDLKGNVKIPMQYSGAMPFGEGLAAVRVEEMHNTWCFIRPDGSRALEGDFHKLPLFGPPVFVFRDGICLVATDYWCYIDTAGQQCWDEDYVYAEPFVHGLAYADTGTKRGYIDRSGEWIYPWN